MSEYKEHLVQAALRDLHISWVPELDASLLSKAKASAVGRRWLTSRLSDLEIFNRPPSLLPIPVEVLQSNEWWRIEFADNNEILFELGGVALMPIIRRAILRDQVTQWRRLLGATLYQRLLRDSDHGCMRSVKFPKVNEPLDGRLDDLSVIEIVRKCAYGELLNFALQQHPVLAQRVVLAFPAAWWNDCRPEPSDSVLTRATCIEIFAGTTFR